MTFADAVNLYRVGAWNEFLRNRLRKFQLPQDLPRLLEEFRTNGVNNQTEFFRHPGALEILKNDILPSYPTTRKVKITSIGTSVGADVYSLLMDQWTQKELVEISGCDVSPQMIGYAKAAEYKTSIPVKLAIPDRFAALGQIEYYAPEQGREEMYRVEHRRDGAYIVMTDVAKQAVNFYEWDILAAPLQEKQDVIFLQNVLQHFSEKGRELILEHAAQSLNSGGFLICESFDGPLARSRYNQWMRDLSKFGLQLIEPNHDQKIYRLSSNPEVT